MKKKLSLLLINLCFLNFIGIKAQNVCCGFDHQHKLMMENPDVRASQEEGMRRMRSRSEVRQQHEGTYIIPVVFHVFGTSFNGGTKVDVALVEDALRKTNEDFKGLTADYNQNDPSSRFEEIKQPLQIEFRLAKIDPKGYPTTGVEFYPDRSGFGNGGGYDEEIRKYAWDNRKYMNVYIMRDLYADGDYYNSGVAWLPDDWMTANNLARVVYNGSYLGTNTDENFRRILTHEFGHFLGLHHTFQGGCTMPNDGVEDTPAVANSHWPKDQKNCFGEYTDWENFMNYTVAYRHFTRGQVALMEDYLSQPSRNTLYKETNLTATGVNDGYVNKPAVIASGKVFNEVFENQGEVEGVLRLETYYGMEFSKTGKAEEGTDYEITGLPEGLSPYLYINNAKSATLRLTGAASKHEKIDGVEEVRLTLKSSMLAVAEGNVEEQTSIFSVYFRNKYTEFCSFEPRFAPCAHISRVQFAQIDNKTDFDNQQWKSFTSTQIAGLQVGETYTLTATVENWDSGDRDAYRVRLWFDWNGDFILEPDELIDTKLISRIGEAGTTHEVTFTVTVPQDVVTDRDFGFRIMLHYYESKLENDGKDPCGVIDSGDVEDYGARIGEPTIIPTPPNPTPWCYPEFSYRPYAYISKVKLNGMENETPATVGKALTIEDFMEDKNLQVTLVKGETYQMEVTCANLDSHPDDPYKVRVYFDWNNNDMLERDTDLSEAHRIDIPKIGAPSDPFVGIFSITVPKHAVEDEPIKMRAIVHYGKVNSMAGELPCGSMENGQLEEYIVYVTGNPDNIENTEILEGIKVYPNPTEGELLISGIETVNGYRLYSVDGRLVQYADGNTNRVDISNNAKGMYILKILTDAGETQRMILLK